MKHGNEKQQHKGHGRPKIKRRPNDKRWRRAAEENCFAKRRNWSKQTLWIFFFFFLWIYHWKNRDCVVHSFALCKAKILIICWKIWTDILPISETWSFTYLRIQIWSHPSAFVYLSIYIYIFQLTIHNLFSGEWRRQSERAGSMNCRPWEMNISQPLFLCERHASAIAIEAHRYSRVRTSKFVTHTHTRTPHDS